MTSLFALTNDIMTSDQLLKFSAKKLRNQSVIESPNTKTLRDQSAIKVPNTS